MTQAYPTMPGYNPTPYGGTPQGQTPTAYPTTPVSSVAPTNFQPQPQLQPQPQPQPQPQGSYPAARVAQVSPQGNTPSYPAPTATPSYTAPTNGTQAPKVGGQGNQNGAYENHQIIRIDGNGVFVEVLDNQFNNDKVRFQFISYDKSGTPGSKSNGFIPFQLTFKEFYHLKYEVLTMGLLTRQPDQYGNLKSYLKGVPSRYNENKQAISRKFEIKTGDKYPVRLVASEGPGKESGQGLIQPVGRPTKTVTVPMSFEDFCGLLFVTEAAIQAHYTARAVGKLLDDQFEKTRRLLGK